MSEVTSSSSSSELVVEEARADNRASNTERKNYDVSSSSSQENEELLHRSNIARRLLDLEILHVLSLEPNSGYELKGSISKTFEFVVSQGTLYPHLHALEASGHLQGIWTRSKKNGAVSRKQRVYSITPKGLGALQKSIEHVSGIALTIQLRSNYLTTMSLPEKEVNPAD